MAKKATIRDDNFYQVCGWMLTKLNLKGVKLSVFAVIYGFSQDGKSRFNGSKDYLGSWSSAGETAVKNALRELHKSGLIVKFPVEHRNGMVYEYAANIPLILAIRRQNSQNTGGQKVTGSESDRGQKVTPRGSESDRVGGQKVTPRGSESDPIYNSYNIEDIIEDNTDKKSARVFPSETEKSYRALVLPIGNKKEKKSSGAKKEKLSLREIEEAVLSWLHTDGKQDWDYATRHYIGTHQQKETEVGMCLANLERKGQSFRLQKTAEMPSTITSELVLWYQNSFAKERGAKSLTNANTTSRKTQNHENLISPEIAAAALQNLRARRGEEFGFGNGAR